MSNVLKSVYFNVDAKQKHIIDSEQRMEELIPQMYTAEESKQDSYTFQPLTAEELASGQAQSFQDGIPVIHMDDVREEERQKLSDEVNEQVMQEKNDILAKAEAEAEELVQHATQQAEQIKTMAHSEGFDAGKQEGLAAAEEQLQQIEEELHQSVGQELDQIRQQRQQMEPFFADLTAKLVEKLTGQVCAENKEVILHLIQNAEGTLDRPKQVVLRVSGEDMAAVSGHKAELKEQLPEQTEFDILEDASLSANQCIIETEDKMIDCSLDVQLQNLQEKLHTLAL